MSKKKNAITRKDLIKRIAKKAGISKGKAKKAYEAIFSEGPTIRKQKMTVVKLKKKVPVKVFKEVTVVRENDNPENGTKKKGSNKYVKELNAKIIQLKRKLKSKKITVPGAKNSSKNTIKKSKRPGPKAAQKVISKVESNTSSSKSVEKNSPTIKIEKISNLKPKPLKKEARPKINPVITKEPVEKKTITPITRKHRPKKKDDLTKIEGIGPAISQLLNNNGIVTYKDLAQAKVISLQNILDQGGGRFRVHKPGAWPEQSALADDGKWEDLNKLQERLKGDK
ncbi:MAG: hypothetical protein P8M34_14560 [Saprospiraceae bacterium]|nr:hypothetical protein [Saprospiraceae bacterium]